MSQTHGALKPYIMRIASRKMAAVCWLVLVAASLAWVYMARNAYINAATLKTMTLIPATLAGIGVLMLACLRLSGNKYFVRAAFVSAYVVCLLALAGIVNIFKTHAGLLMVLTAMVALFAAIALTHITHALCLPWQVLPARLRNWRWARHQKKWYGKWHLYLGLFAGAVLVIIGTTGSVLVFQNEIDAAFNPTMLNAISKQPKIPVYQIADTVRKYYPQLKFDYVGPADYKSPVTTYRFLHRPTETEFFINPYTGRLTGKRLFNSGFVGFMLRLHTSLLVPVVGHYIAGLCALCMLILTISGLRLWLPAKLKHLRAAMSVKFSGGFKRQNLDWHNVIGLYTAPIVAVIALTGVAINFDAVFIGLLFMLNGRPPAAIQEIFGKQSVYKAGSVTLSPAKIYPAISDNFPDARLEAIGFPANKTASYMFYLRGPGSAASGNLILAAADQYTGKLLLNSLVDFPPTGSSYLNYTTPLHFGTFGGMPTRILALLGGLVPLALFITGFIIWWPRYKKQHNKPQHATAKKPAGHRKPKQGDVQLKGGAFAGYTFKRGVKYAFIFLVCTAACGILYGLISGIVIPPAAYMVLYTGNAIVVNFLVALLVLLFQTLVLLPFGKHYRRVYKYFILSIAFLVVFLPAILIVNHLPFVHF